MCRGVVKDGGRDGAGPKKKAGTVLTSGLPTLRLILPLQNAVQKSHRRPLHAPSLTDDTSLVLIPFSSSKRRRQQPIARPRWPPVPRTLASRPLRFISPARFVPPSCRTCCNPLAKPADIADGPNTVCRAIRAGKVRRCQHWQVHNWSRPDQDELLRRS